MDPVIYARMAQLIQEEKKLTEELRELNRELIPLWEGRVELAIEKDRDDLARQAQGRVRQLEERLLEIEHRLEAIASAKKDLRYQSRRPTGREVERSEAMLESVRLGGLVDPDEASLEREIDELDEDAVTLDFGEDD